MQQYDAYRDSGVEWLGKIPEGWDLRRISSLYDVRNEKVSDQDYPALSVTMQGVVPQLETAAKTQDGDNRKLVKAGDFVINSRSDRRGACGISELDGSVTLISNVLSPRENLDMVPRYFSYLFRSEGFADEYYRQGTGIVDDLWSTNWTRMKNILVACPPPAEQRAIADYLDVKTTEIDGLVADCEREIELLQEYRKVVISEAVTKGIDPTVPMRDSGVEWIGEIPEDWITVPLKYLVRTIESGTSVEGATWAAGQDEKGVLTLSAVYQSRFTPACNKAVEPSLYEHLSCPVRKGSLLISRCNTSEWVGTAAYVDEEHENLYLPDKLWQLTFSNDNICRYVRYALQANASRHYFSALSVGASSTMQNIAKTDLLSVPIAFPSDNLVEKIVTRLNSKTSRIDSLISDKQAMIDKLREYRRSHISEAVTGKFKVTGV
ncbi:hypothetical protein [Raoultibacter massiliensis]|uniref:hypothetical protein n=1 Tax=Raoultibacter massiliensis TaxID=1852371 RepID=UPI003A8CF3FF